MENTSNHLHLAAKQVDANSADKESSPGDVDLQQNSCLNYAQFDGPDKESHICSLKIPSYKRDILDSADIPFGQIENAERSELETYHCGMCSETFCTICVLHQHLTTIHSSCGSYHFNQMIQTAFPRYQSHCQFTQTEEFDFNREGVFDTSREDRKRKCDTYEIQSKSTSEYKVRKVIKTKKTKPSETQRKGKAKDQVKNGFDLHKRRKTKTGTDKETKDPNKESKDPKKEIGDQEDSDCYNSDMTNDYFDDLETEILDVGKYTSILATQDKKMVSGAKICDSRTIISNNKFTSNHNKSNFSKKEIKRNKGSNKSNENHEGKDFKKKNTKNKNVTKNASEKSTAVSLKSTKKDVGKSKKDTSQTSIDDINNCEKLVDGKNGVVTNSKVKVEKYLDETESGFEKHQDDKIIEEQVRNRKQSDEMSTEKSTESEGIRCEICGASFTVKQGLLRHEQLKHEDQMNYKCDLCGKKFMRDFNLQKHTIRVHGGNKGSKNQTEKVKSENLDVNDDMCKDLNEIQTNHVDEDASNSNTDLGNSKKELQTDDKAESKCRRKRRTNAEVKFLKTPHTCELCGLTMPRSKMDVHQRLHTGERPFMCKVCGKGLISQNKLNRHMMIHGEAKRHTCEVCGVGFHMKYKLRMHMHIHTGKKPYLCSICGAEFNHSANLATHTRCVHLQVKPYVCNICGGRYSKRSQLDDHVLSHTTERQYTCRYCGKSFKYFKGMRRHEKGHTEDESFSCGQCGLKFARKENFDRHMVSHGRTEFQCKTCKRVLKDSRALQEHEFTHLVAKGFKCSMCGEMFYSSNKYFSHMFLVHKIQKQEAQLIILDDKLQKELKQKEAAQNVPLLSNTLHTNHVGRDVTSFESSVVGFLGGTKETLNALTRVATENLQLHSQDIAADEKTSLIIPPMNPMVLYEKNRVPSLESVTGNNVGIIISNSTTDAVNFPDHAYGQSIKQQLENGSNLHGNLNLTHTDNSVANNGLNESVLGFVTSTSLTNINFNSYIGQRAQSLTPLTSLTAGLHQDEHGAIESLRRLQDNQVTPVTMASPVQGIVGNQQQHNVVMSSTGSQDENNQSYKIHNLY